MGTSGDGVPLLLLLRGMPDDRGVPPCSGPTPPSPPGSTPAGDEALVRAGHERRGERRRELPVGAEAQSLVRPHLQLRRDALVVAQQATVVEGTSCAAPPGRSRRRRVAVPTPADLVVSRAVPAAIRGAAA